MKLQNIDLKLQKKLQNINTFVYARPSISAVSLRILILLMIQVVMLFLTKSYNSVILIGTTALGGVAVASVNFLIYHEKPFQFLNIIIQGIFIGFLLPQSFPVVVAFFITFFTLMISRCILFKSVNCWINICCVAVMIAWFIGRKYFPDFMITKDLISLKNSSVYMIQNGSFPIYSFDSTITAFLNEKLFSIFKVTIPEGFVSLLWDTNSSIPAFRFNLLTIISAVVIFADNAFSFIIPTLMLSVYAVLIRLFGTIFFGGSFNQGDIILAFLTSGTLFCSVFLIQWYGTVPILLSGKIILGILAGVFAFLVTGTGTSPIGMVYTVLITNFTNIFIRAFQEKNIPDHKNEIKKS
ncbi:MAG: RnfABCDGE type electron transport complex subunit D [Treponema sp.]|nr:RnfABCDGE type electron transport complex subunit D [Treponema sp.]